MTSLSAIYDFHAEYVVSQEVFNVLRASPALGLCIPRLSYLMEELAQILFSDAAMGGLRLSPAQRAGLKKFLAEIKEDADADRGLWKQPVCLYLKRKTTPTERERVQAHERFHAYVSAKDNTVWRKNKKGYNRDTLIMAGLMHALAGVPKGTDAMKSKQPLSKHVGMQLYIFAGLIGWGNPQTAAEEALVRIAEIEWAYKRKDKAIDIVKGNIRRAAKLLQKHKRQAIMEVARIVGGFRQAGIEFGKLDVTPLELLDITEQDFMKAYHRIKKQYGSVRGFIDSIEEYYPGK